MHKHPIPGPPVVNVTFDLGFPVCRARPGTGRWLVWLLPLLFLFGGLGCLKVSKGKLGVQYGVNAAFKYTTDTKVHEWSPVSYQGELGFDVPAFGWESASAAPAPP